MKAKFVREVTINDPETGNEVQLEVYKHPNGSMFAVDSSYLDQNFDDEEPVIFDIEGYRITLIEP